MPGDLSNPEFMFPFYYDPVYEPGTNTFESRPLNVEQIIQGMAQKFKGRCLNKEELGRVKDHLHERHLECRNPGDQMIQETLQNYFKMMKSSRKVVDKWLT